MKLETITFVRPNMGNYRSSDAFAPLAFGILAARTPKNISVKFYDEKIEEIPDDDTPDLVAITVETFTAAHSYQVAEQYRKNGATVVMGGYHPTFLANEALNYADAVVIGDAEGSWEQLLVDYQKGKLQQKYYSDPQRPLDDYVIDRSIFKGKKYAPIEPIQFGRGCQFSCDFCSIKAFYPNSVRYRSIENLLKEIQQLDSKKLIFFVDDNLFNSAEKLQELLTTVRPLNIRWACQISIDVAKNDNLIKQMVTSGCVFVLIGFESLNKNNLKQMAKPWNKTAGDYYHVVRKFHDQGIAVYGTFVFGYEYDTVDSIKQTLQFTLDSRLEIANFNPLTPTPETPLYIRLQRQNRLLYDKWWLEPGYQYGAAIFHPKNIDAQQLVDSCFAAKKKFYSWTAIAMRLLLPGTCFNWFRSGIIGIANIISHREIYNKQNRNLSDSL